MNLVIEVHIYNLDINMFAFRLKWEELSTLDFDLTLFRPVYAPKDFLDILTQVYLVMYHKLGSFQI